MIIIIIMKKKNFWAKIVFGLLPNNIVNFFFCIASLARVKARKQL